MNTAATTLKQVFYVGRDGKATHAYVSPYCSSAKHVFMKDKIVLVLTVFRDGLITEDEAVRYIDQITSNTYIYLFWFILGLAVGNLL